MRRWRLGPQGLKPAFLAEPSGTAEAVPYPKPIYTTLPKTYSCPLEARPVHEKRLATPFQLLLPAQHAHLVGFRFGFGDHAFFLIEDREAGVSKNIVGIELRDTLRNFDCFVQAVQVLPGPAQAVEGIGKVRIGGQGLAGSV